MWYSISNSLLLAALLIIFLLLKLMCVCVFDTNVNLYCSSHSTQLPLRDVDGSKSLITHTERRQVANKSLSADVKRKTWNGAFWVFFFVFFFFLEV